MNMDSVMSEHTVTVSSLTLMYPRFCSKLGLTEVDLAATQHRSDIWTIRLMEQIYDEAMSECCKYVAPERRRKRCGLFLGAMDAFPLVAERYLSNKYSVLEIRRKVTLELLFSLSKCLDVEKRNAGNNDCKFSAVSFRARIFSNFLSEEWDLDCLAIFLHFRASFQSYCKISFAELAAMYPDSDPLEERVKMVTTTVPPMTAAAATATFGASSESFTGLSTLSKSSTIGSTSKKASKKQIAKTLSLEKKKIVAVTLPELACKLQQKSLYFLPELAYPGAPLVALDLAMLPTMCLLFFPNASLKLRTFFADTILHSSLTEVQDALKAAFVDLSAVSDLADKIGFKVEGKIVVPIYTVLQLLCSEFHFGKKADPEAVNLTVKEGNESLRQLNTLYDKNCAVSKEIEKDEKSARIDLANCNTEILKIEKTKRRLERMWDDNVADSETQDEIARLRVLETEKKMEKLSIEAKLKSMRSKGKSFVHNVDSLWDVALEMSDNVVAPKEKSLTEADKKLQVQWREDVVILAMNALKSNGRERAAAAKARFEFEVLIGDRPPPDAPKSPQTAEVEKEDMVAKVEEMDIAQRIFEIERQAAEVLKTTDQSPNLLVEVSEITDPEPLQASTSNIAAAPPFENTPEFDDKELTDLSDAQKHQIEAVITEYVYDITRGSMTNILKDISERRRFERERVLQLLDEKARAITSLAADEVRSVVDGVVSNAAVQIVKRIEIDVRVETSSAEVQLIINNAMAGAADKLVSEIMKCLAEEEALRRVLAEKQQLAAEEALREETERISMEASDVEARLVIAFEKVERLRLLNEKNERDFMAAEENAEKSRLATVKAEQLRLMAAEEERQRLAAEEERQRLAAEEERQRLADEEAERERIAAEEEERMREFFELLEKAKLEAEEAEEAERLRVAAEVAEKQRLIEETVKKLIAEEEEKKRLAEEAEAKRRADPWSSLDDEPESWLPRKTLAIVEKGFRRSQDKWKRESKIFFFKCFVNMLKVKRFREKLVFDTKARVLVFFKENVKEIKVMIKRSQAAKKLQNMFRVCLNRKHLAEILEKNNKLFSVADNFNMKKLRVKYFDSFKYWRSIVAIKRNDKIVTEHILERKRLILFILWRKIFFVCIKDRLAIEKHRRDAATCIQCATRSRVARKRRYVKECQLRIVLACRVFFAHQKFEAAKLKMRRLREIDGYSIRAAAKSIRWRSFQMWKRTQQISVGLTRLFLIFKNKHTRRRFNKLKTLAAAYKKKYFKSIIKIQSALRMGAVKLYSLNYYRWRNGLRKLQGLVRRKVAMSVFYWVLRDFRAAQAIQKIFRGRYIRAQFFDSRIRAIHYAAANNNYDKLMYFVKKYPELLHELDKDGNTALHNAAKTASRRTLKLLVKKGLNPNALNLAGLSPLHLVIASKAINRDDCCLYMMERGFDEDLRTPDGKTCLLIACEHGRTLIARKLLENGMDPNIPDDNGTTCLQAACNNGSIALAKALLDHGADVNAPGRNGTFPLHDVVNSGSIDIVNMLFSHGAYVNATEPYNKQTPLMWACQAAHSDIVHTYLIQGAKVDVKDANRWTAIHYAAYSNSQQVFDELRVADASLDAVTTNGDTSLHIAAQNNSTNFVKALLEAGAYPSVQNMQGDQPIHYAAMNDNLECLKLLCLYDQHVSRVNYAHQTPLGVAKFHSAMKVIEFLEKHYVYLEDGVVRDADGIVWWDREIDQYTDGWRAVDVRNGERLYINDISGEICDRPPEVSLKLVTESAVTAPRPMRKLIEVTTEDNTNTTHGYKLEYQDMKTEIAGMSRIYRAATVISKYGRRKVAYMALRREKQRMKIIRCMAKFVRLYHPYFKARMNRRKEKGVIKFQGVVRGQQLRKVYFLPGAEHYRRWIFRTKRDLARAIWRNWKNYRANKRQRLKAIIVNQPKTIMEWEKVVIVCKRPNRIIGVYEEYYYPGTTDIKFYRNKITRVSSFLKPPLLENIDRQRFKDLEQLMTLGYTSKQSALAIKLQAYWRGYTIRNYYKVVGSALQISLVAESTYFAEPDVDHHLWNYTLHCHVILLDFERARRLYMEALTRMAQRGPDQAFILYAYSIFAFVTQDLDLIDIVILLDRAKKAEADREVKTRQRKGQDESQAIAKGTFNYGKIFRQADVGFFRYKAMSSNTALAAHNYAASRYLIFNDFLGSFDSFLTGFKYDAKDKKLRSNFDTMMRHFHGNDKEHLADIVKDRMRILAARDGVVANERQLRREAAMRRTMAAKRIQVWYKEMRSARAFSKFIEAVKSFKKERDASKRRK